mgnify:CR=1 FL=1
MQSVSPSGNMGLDPYAEMRRLDRKPLSEQTGIVASQFEGIFVREFLQEALKPMAEGALGDSVPGKDVYQSMIIDTVADGIEKGGGLGMANVIQLQLQGLGAQHSRKHADNNA